MGTLRAGMGPGPGGGGCRRVLVAALCAWSIACGAPAPPSAGQAQPGTSAAATDDAPSPADALLVELIEVVRISRDVIEVRLALVNGGTQPLDLGARFAQREQDGASVSGMALVEVGVPKKTFVLRDARDQPACTTGLSPLAPGERRAVWARFPAPASSIVTVDLPGLPPVARVDVPSPEAP